MELFSACSRILEPNGVRGLEVSVEDIEELLRRHPTNIFNISNIYNKDSPIVKKLRKFEMCSTLPISRVSSGSYIPMINNLLSDTNDLLFVSDVIHDILIQRVISNQTIQSICKFIDFIILELDKKMEGDVKKLNTNNMGTFLIKTVYLSFKRHNIIIHFKRLFLFLNEIVKESNYVISYKCIDFISHEIQNLQRNGDENALLYMYGLYIFSLIPFLNLANSFIRGTYIDDLNQEFIVYKPKETDPPEAAQLYADDSTLSVFTENVFDRHSASVFDSIWGLVHLRTKLPSFLSLTTARMILSATKGAISLALLGVRRSKEESLVETILYRLEEEFKQGEWTSTTEKKDESIIARTQESLQKAFSQCFPNFVYLLNDTCVEVEDNFVSSEEDLHSPTDADGMTLLKRIQNIAEAAIRRNGILEEEGENFTRILHDMQNDDCCQIMNPFTNIISITNKIINDTLLKRCEKEQQDFQETFLGNFNIREHFNILLSTLLLSAPEVVEWFYDFIVNPLIPEKNGTGLTADNQDLLRYESLRLSNSLNGDKYRGIIKLDSAIRVKLVEKLDIYNLAENWFDKGTQKIINVEDEYLHLSPVHSLENMDHIVMIYAPYGPFNVMLGTAERMAYIQISRMLRQRRYCSFVIGHIMAGRFKTGIENEKKPHKFIYPEMMKMRYVMAFRQMMQSFLSGLESFSYDVALEPLLSFSRDIGKDKDIAIWDLVASHRKILSGTLEALKCGNTHIIKILEGIFEFCTLVKEGSTFVELKKTIQRTRIIYNALIQYLSDQALEKGRHSDPSHLLRRIPQ